MFSNLRGVLDFNEAPLQSECYEAPSQDPVSGFLAALAAHDLVPGVIIPDGKLHRFDVDKRGDKVGWYVLYNDAIPAGAFGNWKTGLNEDWCSVDKSTLTPTQRATLDEQIKKAQAERDRLIAEGREDAAKLANKILNDSAPAANHQYLMTKGVEPHGVRVDSVGRLVVPMRNEAGALRSLQFIGVDGTKKFLPGGEITGNFYEIKGDDAVYICEGYATGATIQQATGATVIMAFNTGNLKPVAEVTRRRYPARDIVIAADNDQWSKLADGTENPGLTYTRKAAEAIGAEVACPQFANLEGKPTDFNDLSTREGFNVVKNQLLSKRAGSSLNVNIEDEWQTPTDIINLIPPAPTFPVDALPGCVRNYVEDNVHRMQIPVDMIAVPFQAILAGLIGSGVCIRPKKHDTWSERACLYSMVIAPKGSMKSVALKVATASLNTIQRQYAKEDQERISEWEKLDAEIKMREKAYNKKCNEILKKDPSAELPAPPELFDNRPPRPIERRILVADATIEKLAELMPSSKGLTLFRDELSGWATNMNRYTNGNDRQFYLECYSGGSYHVDRMTRRPLYVPDLHLNIVGGIQPEVARLIFGGAGPDDGLFERFALITYPDAVKDWQLVDRKPNYEVDRQFKEVCKRLAEAQWYKIIPFPGEIGAAWNWENGEKPFVRFSEDAQTLFNSWITRHMKYLESLSDDDPLKGMYGKQRGVLVRVALVLHLVKCAALENEDYGQVSYDTLVSAMQIVDEFLPAMWKRIFAAFGRDDTDVGAKKIATWIINEKPQYIKVREIRLKNWKNLKDNKQIEAALELLIAHNWIGEPVKLNKNGRGRPSFVYPVNPKVHNRK